MLDIRHFINDTSFQMIYRNNEIDIINYKEINYMEESKISINYYNKSILITGTNLTVKKLLDNEILVAGNFKKVEFL